MKLMEMNPVFQVWTGVLGMKALLIFAALLFPGCVSWSEGEFTADLSPLAPDGFYVEHTRNDIDHDADVYDGRGSGWTAGFNWDLFGRAAANQQMALLPTTLHETFEPFSVAELEGRQDNSEALLEALRELNAELREQSEHLAVLSDASIKAALRQEVIEGVLKEQQQVERDRGYIPYIPDEHETKVEIGTLLAAAALVMKLRGRNGASTVPSGDSETGS
jgi:hypothetical protein